MVLFVCIIKENTYFYSLYQCWAVCLLRNYNVFTFYMYFYHFCRKKCRQIAAKCIKIVKINHICQKRHKKIDNLKKIQEAAVGFEPTAPQETQIWDVLYYKMSFFDGFLTYLSILQIYDCFWMFGTNLEVSQRPVQTLPHKPQVGARWCSYLELAIFA